MKPNNVTPGASSYVSPRFVSNPNDSYHAESMRNTYGSQSLQSNRNNYRMHRNTNKSINPKPKTHLPKDTTSIRQSIPKLMQQMEEALQSNRTSSFNSKFQYANSQVSSKYPSQVSVLKSGISVLSRDLAKEIRLPKLQSEIMETLLSLRQMKITLLCELSQGIDQKCQIEREIKRVLKSRQKLGERLANQSIIQVSVNRERELNELNPNRNRDWANKNSYFPAVERYVMLKSKLKQLEQDEKQNEQEYKLQLQKIYQENKGARQEFEKYERTNRLLQETQYMLKNEDYDQIIAGLQYKIKQLENERKQYQESIDLQKFDEINTLREQNAKLISQANSLLAKKKRMGEITSLEGLRKLIALEDGLKDELFNEMRILKKDYGVLRKQNTAMMTLLERQ